MMQMIDEHLYNYLYGRIFRDSDGLASSPGAHGNYMYFVRRPIENIMMFKNEHQNTDYILDHDFPIDFSHPFLAFLSSTCSK